MPNKMMRNIALVCKVKLSDFTIFVGGEYKFLWETCRQNLLTRLWLFLFLFWLVAFNVFSLRLILQLFLFVFSWNCALYCDLSFCQIPTWNEKLFTSCSSLSRNTVKHMAVRTEWRKQGNNSLFMTSKSVLERFGVKSFHKIKIYLYNLFYIIASIFKYCI